ncbi:MAG: nucleotidyltransferase domain-containing protein [Candidatus Methanomethylophilaceae archaeon]|nr:nucleotidyltransferase domain-containing protein [Candidatus Methanomethylophilaceae archaeon]
MSDGGNGRHGYTADEMASIVAPIAERHNVTAVYLFGSRATGRNGPDSDYDFILDTTDDFSFSDYCGFTDELSEALGRPVDIVDRSCLSDDGFSRRARREEVHVWG